MPAAKTGSSRVSALVWESLLVAVASFAFFAQGIERTDITSAFSNPIDRLRAQDESSYASGALHTAQQGNWLTPIVMGRIFLFKPPLLYMASGLSLKLFGFSLFSLRLPSVLAGSLTAALLFFWCSRVRGLWAGIAAVLLLLANSAWFTFARLCYTDMLLAFFTVAAIFSLTRDPKLESNAARWSFIAFDAAAILTKSVAGIVPLLALALFAWLGPRGERPNWGRIVRVVAWIALLAAPWHFYQLAFHRQWFWADYVQVQLLQFGMRPITPGSTEIPVWFYLKRLFLTDPFLCLAAAMALPAWVAEVRRRNGNARLLACWVAVVFVCISLFQYRNFSYTIMLVAPLCLLAACYLPAKSQRLAVALLVLILGAKVLFPERRWSLSYASSHPMTAPPLLRSYMARGRSNELILVDTDDQFYSATLPLPKVRYCFRDPGGLALRDAPYYLTLGIMVQTAVFDDLGRWEPIFRGRLRAWGLDSGDPIATTIDARNDTEIASIVESHPDTDFYLPASLYTALAGAQNTHVYVPVASGRFFLLAKRSSFRAPRWSRMLG